MTLLLGDKAMKLGMMVTCAALATLAFDVNEADAGQKARKQQWSQHGNVHIDSRVSSKNLRALSHKLKGHPKQAVTKEIGHREKRYQQKKDEAQHVRHAAEVLDKRTREAVQSGDASETLFWLGAVGTQVGKRKGH
jgi:hypothetical protein